MPLGEGSAEPRINKVRMLSFPSVCFRPWTCSADLHATCDALPTPIAFIEGAGRGVVVAASRVAHFTRLFLEQGLDSGSMGAACQTDVRTFYDHIDVVQAASVAAAGGALSAVAGAAVLSQLLVGIRARVPGAAACTIGRRTEGALTGSRVACALGRFVVRKLAAHL